MNNVVVVAASRTPLGKIPGKLRVFDEIQLMTFAFEDVVKRIDLDGSKIDSAYVGCNFPKERVNLCRKAILAAGLPSTIPGANITRNCSSSMEAVVQGAYAIIAGDADVVLVGGVESTSNSPYMLSYLKNLMKTIQKHELSRGSVATCAPQDENLANINANKIQQYLHLPAFNDIINDLYEGEMQLISELAAQKHGIAREELDNYALRSHQKAISAYQNGYFNNEIFPVQLPDSTVFSKDEIVLEHIDIEMLKKAEPFYVQDGIMTLLNSPPLADGAAAMILMSEQRAKAEGLKPMAKFHKSDVVGVPREEFGLGMVEAVKSILKKTNLSVNEIDLWECNEVYGPQAVIAQNLFNIDDDKYNANGGCIPMGLTIGGSGLKLCVTLIHEMNRRNVEYGLATGCAGGGMGEAVIFQNY